jgi:hypothetical protein
MRVIDGSQRTTSVDRPAESIDHTAKQRVSDRNRRETTTRYQPRAGTNAGRVAEGNRQQFAVLKSNHFNRKRPVARRANHFTDFADACVRPLRFDEQANRADHASHERRERRVVERAEAVIEREPAI